MLNRLTDRDKGFTLIEVVLVLAIAGLIFIIIFLAVSQAQAARRDTHRRTDANRYVAAVNSWSANNQGNIPSSGAEVDDVTDNYLEDDFSDPSAGPYDVGPGNGQDVDLGVIHYVEGQVCDGNTPTATGAGARDFAIVLGMERGDQACVDSSS